MSENKAAEIIESKADSSSPVTVPKEVTIFRKEESSAYFKRNAKFIPEGKVKIGSSINGVNRLKSSMDEMAVYMPVLLGIDRNNPKYNESVDLWFNNISRVVPERGLTLQIGFTYNNDNARKTIEDIEESIYERYNRASKTTSKDRNKAIETRDAEIINLEKTKYKYGFPINVSDYLLWRYCLVYGDVANDIAVINMAGGIRFYIYDAKREEYKEKIKWEIRKKASIIYVKLFEMPDTVDNMLWTDRGNQVDIVNLTDMDKYKMLENMYKANPADFIKLYEDKNLETKSIIERMIHFGILKRLENSSVIVDENNDIIGNNIDEAITFFKNIERNKAAITRFKSKLREYTNG